VKVGLVGLGNIGKPIGERMLSEGLEVMVYDVRREAVEDFEALGAAAAESPAELAGWADVASVAVLNDAQVKDVVLGEEGLLAGEPPLEAVLIHSTVSPSTCRWLAEQASRRGTALMDAQVSGGTPAAATGTLTIMLGGDNESVPLVEPIVDAIGEKVLYMGPSGSGALAKIVNQLVLFSNLVAAHEAVALGVAGGLQEERLVESIGSSTGKSWVTENWRYYHRLMETHTLGAEGVVGFMLKDVDLGLEAAREVGFYAPLAVTTRDLLPSIFDDRADGGEDTASARQSGETQGREPT
jgi:3-hydroxyisobutyrate dehydrogenase